jgi:hypothetical protein
MSTEKYVVLYKGEKIALIFISPHPDYIKHFIATIIPLAKKGKWEKSTLEINIEDPHHDIFPNDIKTDRLIEELLAGARIEPDKVTYNKM